MPVYAVEVTTGADPKFYGNALTFPGPGEAEDYAWDLFSRWTAVRTWRIVRIVPTWGGVCERVEVKRKGA